MLYHLIGEWFLNQSIKLILHIMGRRIHSQKYPVIHPSDLYKPYLLKRQSIQQDALVVEQWLSPPDEVESSAFTHHVLIFQVNEGNMRQVNRVDGKEYDGPFPKGTLCFVPAGASKFGYWESTDEGVALFAHPCLIQKIALETEYLNPEKIEFLPTPMARDPQLATIGMLFQHELTMNSYGSSLYLESLANVLGIHLLRNYCAFQPKKLTDTRGFSKSKLRQAIAYIHDHLEQDISLDAIATYLGMSQYHFCRWFKQSMGVPPYQYVIQQRIERAKALLENRELNLVDVALECGFNSQSHLIRHFKKQMGITPRQYRQL